MRNFSQQIFEERYGRPSLAEWHFGIYSGMTMLGNWRRQIPKLASQNIQTFWKCKAKAKASSVVPKIKFA